MLLSFQEMREIRERRRCELAHRKTYFEYRAYGASHQSTRSDNGEEIGHFVIKESRKFAGGDALMGNTRTHPEHDG